MHGNVDGRLAVDLDWGARSKRAAALLEITIPRLSRAASAHRRGKARHFQRNIGRDETEMLLDPFVDPACRAAEVALRVQPFGQSDNRAEQTEFAHHAGPRPAARRAAAAKAQKAPHAGEHSP